MNCALCLHTEFEPAISGIRNPRRIGAQEYSYRMCRNCCLWMLTPYPSAEEINQIYDNSYELYEEESTSIITKIIETFSTTRIEVIKKYLPVPSNVLDIGCGTGTFLKKLKDNNYSVHGTEWSASAAEKARQKVEDEDVVTLGEVTGVSGTFNAATIWHVLEHNSDPRLFIENIKSKLNNGYIFVEVPNADSIVLQKTRAKYPWLSIPEHVTYWNKQSLEYLATETGFEIIESKTPLAMLMLYAKAEGSTNKWISPFLQIYASMLGKGDIIRQVWKQK